MRLELDDFSTFDAIQKGSESIKSGIKEENLEQKIQEIESFYQEKIEQMEKDYKELLNKVSKESYEQGFSDARQKLQKELEDKIAQIQQELARQKEGEIAQLQKKYLNFEQEFAEKYNLFLTRFTDILLDNVAEILEFLFIDKKNAKTISEAIEKLLDDFSNYMPLDIIVSKKMYEDVKDRFKNVSVKKSNELKNNEFVIEFHDFKIENRIKEKLDVIKDEIKRETKKLT